MAPGVFVKVDGMEDTAEGGSEVSQQVIAQAELPQHVGVMASTVNRFVVAVGRGHGPEAGQGIRKNRAAWRHVFSGPVTDRF